MTDEISRREGVQRAPTVPDTGRPSQASPWVDAPTHDGLWWVLGADEPTVYRMVYRTLGDIPPAWYAELTGSGIYPTYLIAKPSWKFAPAVPPAPPTASRNAFENQFAPATLPYHATPPKETL